MIHIMIPERLFLELRMMCKNLLGFLHLPTLQYWFTVVLGWAEQEPS